MKRTALPRAVVCAVSSCLLATAAVPARASTSDLGRQVGALERQAQGLTIRFTTDNAKNRTTPARRLVDAQLLYTLGDYTQAAILLLDYVENYRGGTGYAEALYYLGDSLYQRRDFIGARRYMTEIVNRVHGPYYQEALQRLVELSLRNPSDTADVAAYLGALERMPAASRKSSATYVLGKYYYFHGKLNRALSWFKAVPSGQPYSMQARYFTGVCQVRQGHLDQARATFQALVKMPTPANDADKRVQQLARLAVGRLYYQKGKLASAIDEYQAVPRTSDLFDVALYESAWVYIKARQYDQALRALDLLVLAQPDSRLMPDVKVLQGNLMIRLQAWGKATNVFAATRETFRPLHDELATLLAETHNTDGFFEALLPKDFESGPMTDPVALPPMATTWLREQPPIKRAVGVAGDLHDGRVNVAQTELLLRRLEAVVNSPAKVKVYPAFAAGRLAAVEVENRLVKLLRALLTHERKLVKPVLNASERAELAILVRRRERGLEARVAELPTDEKVFRSRKDSRMKRLEALEQEMSRIGVLVQGLKAQLVAAAKYFADTGNKRDENVRRSFGIEANELRLTIRGLERDIDELSLGLADARDAAGVGGPEEVDERDLKRRYREAVQAEHAFLAKFRDRLGPAQQGDLADVDGLMARCMAVDSRLELFNAKLEQAVDQKLQSIRAQLADARAQLPQYNAELVALERRTDEVGGQLAQDGLQSVTRRLYDIVVRSDVGIIDVSWALKDATTKEVSRLVRQRKLDLKLLDDEFKGVLKD